jgi:hypothetical protein
MSREIRSANAYAFTMSCAKNENARMSANPYKLAFDCLPRYTELRPHVFAGLIAGSLCNPVNS